MEPTPPAGAVYESQRPGLLGAQGTWQPKATYGLLAGMAAVYVLQLLTQATRGGGAHDQLFVISTYWWLKPWTLVTSTFSHGSPSHLFFNGIVLYFFGASLERILGWRTFLIAFLVAGAVSGVLQVTLQSAVVGAVTGALGASGAILMVLGALVVLMPKMEVLLFFIVPVPLWAITIGYAVLDILGAFAPNVGIETGIGHFAHLSGLALGLLIGWLTQRELARRGMRVQYG